MAVFRDDNRCFLLSGLEANPRTLTGGLVTVPHDSSYETLQLKFMLHLDGNLASGSVAMNATQTCDSKFSMRTDFERMHVKNDLFSCSEETQYEQHTIKGLKLKTVSNYKYKSHSQIS